MSKTTQEYWREAVFAALWHGLQNPTESALLPLTQLIPTEVEDYQEEVILSLSSARELAAKAIQKAQKQYKTQYDHKSTKRKY